MIGVVILIVLAVSGLVAFAYYTDQDLVTNSITNVLDYKPEIDCNVVGDCIEFFVPIAPENHETIPVNYNTDDVTNATYYANGTLVPEASYITGNINDLSYTKQGTQQTKYSAVDGVMRVQIGNIISIEGQIKIINPDTGELVEPRTAKYTLTMDCSDLSEFCNMVSVTRRGTTTTAGTFLEKISTNLQSMPALYEITMFAVSETKDQFGIPYDVKNTLFVELYK